MRKTSLILLILLLSVISVNAWIDCTPSPCPTGYVDNGTWCENGDCYRNCIGLSCTGEWTLTYTNQMEFHGDEARNSYSSSAYTSNNENLCYQFELEASNKDIRLDATNGYDPSGDATNCDSEAISGFWESGKPTNPWYENLTDSGDWGSNYWGDVSYSTFDYFFIANRGSNNEDSFTSPSYHSDMLTDYSIYCAPNEEACSQIGDYKTDCDITCYDHSTYAHIAQIWVKDYDSSDSTTSNNNNLRSWDDCPDSEVSANFFRYPNFKVYTKNTIANLTNNQVCTRTNEVPIASNITINGNNAGDDLSCNFIYYDIEGFEEKDSTYEWYKNGVPQNISSKILIKDYTEPNDIWSCSVIPCDGLVNGTKIYSSNITILSTINNPKIYIENKEIWNYSGYYSKKELNKAILDEITNVLDNCTKNENGLCNISLTFSSDSSGKLNISKLEIYQRERIPRIEITDFENNYSNKTIQGFSFKIKNTGDTILEDISWTINTENDYNITGQILKLERNQEINIYREYDYSNIGYYNVNISVSNTNISDSIINQIYVGDLMITDFQEVENSDSFSIIKFTIKNRGYDNLENINWIFRNDHDEVTSVQSFNLSNDNDAIVFVKTKYNSPGIINLTAIVNNSNEYFEKNISVDIECPLNIVDLEVKSIKGPEFIFGFVLDNSWNIPIENLNWNISFGDNIITNQNELNLSANNNIIYYLKHNYDTYGIYNIEINVYNDFMSEYKNMTLTIDSPLSISRLFESSYNKKNVYGLTLKNMEDWFTDVNNISWKLDTGERIISNYINLSSGDDALVFIAHNYSKSGVYIINASMSNGTIYDENIYSVNVNPFDINKIESVYKNTEYEIYQVISKNSWNMKLENTNWILIKDNQTTTGSQNLTYEKEDEVLYWITSSNVNDSSIKFKVGNFDYMTEVES
jgi:hypothetical protein